MLVLTVLANACDRSAESAPQTAALLTGEATIAFASHFGGSGNEAIRDVAVDAEGNVYLAGGTTSPDFPITPGVLGPRFNNPGAPYQDAFIVKLSPDGRVIWSTYLGGPFYDRVYGIEVDAQGYVYVAGRGGPGFPVTPGAFQTQFGGGSDHVLYGEQDGFICKLTPDGTAIVFCSYFGDRDGAPIRDLALDPNGDIYVVASTDFGELPAAWFANAFQKSLRGGRDLVIAKISNDGTRVVWATYLGGSDAEYNTTSIRVDGQGHSYVMTTTRSPDAPVTAGFDQTLGGESDIYVAKLAPDGARLIWGTYYGGSQREYTETHELAIDAQGHAIIAAMTTSSDLPVTAGAFQATYGGRAESKRSGAGTNYAGDAFVAKISPNGAALVASSYLGGTGGDGAEGVSVDAAGNIYVSGGTYAKDLHGVASGPGGETDVMAAKLSPDLRQILHVVRLGGTAGDVARSNIVDAKGNFYVVGETKSANFPTARALQKDLRGENDGAIVKITFH